MKTYLSIDLDYWFANGDGDINDLYRMLYTISDRPSIIVDEHHHIKEHIDSFDVDRIIHIDYHQDIVYPVNGSHFKIDCGNFFFFLKNRRDIDYEWYYPDIRCRTEGLCIDERYKPYSKKNFVFKSQTRKKGLPTLKSLKDVVAIGIACSYFYCFDVEEEIVNATRLYLNKLLSNCIDKTV